MPQKTSTVVDSPCTRMRPPIRKNMYNPINETVMFIRSCPGAELRSFLKDKCQTERLQECIKKIRKRAFMHFIFTYIDPKYVTRIRIRQMRETARPMYETTTKVISNSSSRVSGAVACK